MFLCTKLSETSKNNSLCLSIVTQLIDRYYGEYNYDYFILAPSYRFINAKSMFSLKAFIVLYLFVMGCWLDKI